MNKRFWQSLDRTNALVALAVSLAVLVVYVLTKAPTVSLWDCGEFIACSYILGIPHPPGTPLYILIGRLFGILPLAADAAARVNALSVVSSTFTAFFAYLTAVRILRLSFGASRSAYTRFLIYGGGACGTLFLAWSITNWNNSVEAEVYGLSMMMLMAMLWLTTILVEKRGEASAEKIMLLIVYLAFLGIGVHMATFLMAPAAALVFILKKKADARAWYALAIFVAVEMFLVFAMSSRPDEIPFFVPVVIVFVFYLFYIFSCERLSRWHLVVALGFMLSAMPLYAVTINAVMARMGVEGSLSEGTLQAASALGKIFFAALVLVGVNLLFRYLKRYDDGPGRGGYLSLASFVFFAAGMVALLFTFKGYGAFLVFSAVLSLALLIYLRRFIDWPVLIAIVGASAVVLGIREFAYSLVAAAVLVLILGIRFRMPRWRSALMILLMAVMGFSVHMFIPIRSSRNPNIDENNPSQNLTATINFLERKQYGAESMVERMFVRRGEWANQFGVHNRMGFWKFFNEQYGIRGPRFIVLFLIGIFGIWEVVRRRPDIGLPLTVFLLLCSVGLVLYMNFADGTRQHLGSRDYIEVRDRDYFFTPAFVLFGLAIGMGVSAIIQYIRDLTAKFSVGPKKVILAALPVLLLLPAVSLARNYHYCDRSQNFIAYGYAWNLLSSTDKDAVLFTFGDNDTFPLWCLQEALGVRRDVKVVNLTLSNAKWYVKQIQNTLKVDLGWTDETIDRLRSYRLQDGTPYLLQDQVVTAIIANNFGRRPINFSVTVSSRYRRYQGRSLDHRLLLTGMSWRLLDSGEKISVDAEAAYDFFTNPQKFRDGGLDDPGVFKSETARRLSGNYATGMLRVAEELKGLGDYKRAEELIRKTMRLVPHYPNAIDPLASIMSRQGRLFELRALIDSTEGGDRPWLNTVLARTEIKHGDAQKGERILNGVLVSNPTYRAALDELMRLYFDTKNVLGMKALLQRWLQFNPGDDKIRMMLMELQKGIARDSNGG